MHFEQFNPFKKQLCISIALDAFHRKNIMETGDTVKFLEKQILSNCKL